MNGLQALEHLSIAILGSRVTQLLIAYSSVITRVLAVLVFYVIGVAYYTTIEGWTVTDCIYFITVSVTTVGYGHFVPTTDNSRIFTTFYDIVGVLLVLDAVNVFSLRVFGVIQEYVVDSLSPSKSFHMRTLKKIALSVLSIAIAVFIGTVFFAVNEGWSVAISYYWVISTMLTIGYGDFVLKQSSEKFSIFFILFVVSIYMTAIHNIVDAMREVHREQKRAFVLSTNFTQMEMINTFSTVEEEKYNMQDNMLKKLDMNQFIVDSLVKMGIADQKKDIDPLVASFKQYQLRASLSQKSDSSLCSSEV